jgi:hypothetical protein
LVISGTIRPHIKQMKKREPIKDNGPYLVDYRRAGSFMDNTTCLVMDNVWDRDKQKLRVKVVRTSNPGLYAGSSTVAVFRIKEMYEPNETDS